MGTLWNNFKSHSFELKKHSSQRGSLYFFRGYEFIERNIHRNSCLFDTDTNAHFDCNNLQWINQRTPEWSDNELHQNCNGIDFSEQRSSEKKTAVAKQAAIITRPITTQTLSQNKRNTLADIACIISLGGIILPPTLSAAWTAALPVTSPAVLHWQRHHIDTGINDDFHSGNAGDILDQKQTLDIPMSETKRNKLPTLSPLNPYIRREHRNQNYQLPQNQGR